MIDSNDAALAATWASHRPHLLNLAFRMLGDLGEAEDVVQESFSRLVATTEQVHDAVGWLIVVASRLCLDRIRSARSRHEQTQDFRDDEPNGMTLTAVEPDPADRVTLDDTVRLALLVLMQRLTASERVIFVLHDVFQMPFEDVAATVGRPVGTCRQIARRARQRIEAETAGGRRFLVAPAEHREVTERFIAACANGDLAALVAVLDPDVSGEVDLGVSEATPGVLHGAEAVGSRLLGYWQSATLVSLPPIGDYAAVLGFRGHELAAVIVLTISGNQVSKIHVLVDPAKLAFVRSQLQLRK